MPASKSEKVLVLGAGIAGLAAAQTLVAQGMSVTVLEARDRIGGRTVTNQLWDGIPIDMGASWIHGVTENPLTEIADTLGMDRYPTSYENTIAFGACGESIDYNFLATKAENLVEAARKAVCHEGDDISLRTAVLASAEWTALSDDDKHLMRAVIHTRIEHEYSGDWDRLSAWNFDDGDDFPGGDVVMSEGYGPIVKYLAQNLDIQLNEIVSAITPNDYGVTVSTSQSMHEADYVIVTLPLGVLKSGDVQFGAPLKKSRQKAIDRLEMGLLNKCWLHFGKAFWPADVNWIDYNSPGDGIEPGYWPEWTSFSEATGKAILVGFNAAAAAEEMEDRGGPGFSTI